MVTGTLHLCGYYAYTIFDSGSTHSFILFKFVHQAQLELESLGYELSVSTSSGIILMTCERVKVDRAIVSRQAYMWLLMILDIYDYDIILDMNRLFARHANIDSYKRKK